MKDGNVKKLKEFKFTSLPSANAEYPIRDVRISLARAFSMEEIRVVIIECLTCSESSRHSLKEFRKYINVQYFHHGLARVEIMLT